MKKRTPSRLIISPLFMWKEPRCVTEWVIKNELVPEYKEFLRSLGKLGKWMLLIGVPVFCALWKWTPESIFPALFSGAMILFVIPTVFIAQQWTVTRFSGTSCVINENSLGKNVGFYQYPWKNIESYWFAAHPDISDVRCLWIKAKRDGLVVERSFCFSPSEVEEAKIAELLRSHLHLTPHEVP